MSCVHDAQKFRQFQVVVVQRRLGNVQKSMKQFMQSSCFAYPNLVIAFFPFLLNVVVVLFNLPNVEIEWKLSVPEQLLILKNRYNFSFDNEATWTRLGWWPFLSYSFFFSFFLFEECRMGSEAVSNETRTLLKIQMPLHRNPPPPFLKNRVLILLHFIWLCTIYQ